MLAGKYGPLAALTSCALLACTPDVDLGHRCARDDQLCVRTHARPSQLTAGSPASDVTGGAAGSAIGEPTLRVHIEDDRGNAIERLTLDCAQRCADVVAVVEGGSPPYVVEWNDGALGETRRVCASAPEQLIATARDSIAPPPSTAVLSVDVGACLPTTSAPATSTAEPLCLPNGSFEGPPRKNVLPPSWTPCVGTPDTHPVPAMNAPPAKDGASYVALLSNFETIESPLCAPLRASTRVPFSLAIQLSSMLPKADPASAVAVEIWGSSSSCAQEELLWTSPPVSALDVWTSFCATLTPSRNYQFVQLVPTGPGYVMIDAFSPQPMCN